MQQEYLSKIISVLVEKIELLEKEIHKYQCEEVITGSFLDYYATKVPQTRVELYKDLFNPISDTCSTYEFIVDSYRETYGPITEKGIKKAIIKKINHIDSYETLNSHTEEYISYEDLYK